MARGQIPIYDFAKAMVDAGLIGEQEIHHVSRIVIDADASRGTVEMHVTKFGDDKVLEIPPILKGILDG